MNSRFYAFTLFALSFAMPSFAVEPGWSPIIVPTGAYRAEIKSMPIEQRPYRPGHFYGNTVRRRYYRNEIATPVIGNVYSGNVYSPPVAGGLRFRRF